MSKPVICAYLPPSSVCNPRAFITNLLRFKPAIPLILFSEAPEHQTIGYPVFRMRASPEVACIEQQPKWPAVSNMVFLSACVLAQRNGYTHLIYLEEDCRVVENWDQTVWDEYVKAGKPHAFGGSIVIYNTHSMSGRAVRDARELKAKNWERNVPVAEYGKPTSPPPHRAAVFPNGALGVYPLAAVDRMFKFSQGGTVNTARDMAAYDHEIGWKLYAEHGEHVFDHVVQLNSVFSTYKDQVVPFEQRQQWLTGRTFVAIHPVKNDWDGPEVLSSRLEGQGNAPTQSTAVISKSALPATGAAEHPTVTSIVTASSDADCGSAPVTAAPSLRMDILIVTFAPDAWWLEQCLRSIAKFCRGFGAVHVAFPNQDIRALAPVMEMFADTKLDFSKMNGTMLKWHGYDEAPAPLAHLDHNIRKCTADLFCPDADLIAHVDSDCLFREPTTPDDYLVDGKPVLLIESFEKLKTEHPGRHAWKAVVDAALNIDCKFETMCRHPAVHWRGLYPLMRERIEQVHGKSFQDYVLGCKADRPCGYAEFPTLGAYALGSKFFKTKYHFVDVTTQPRPHEKLLQFWSRQKPELEQTIWIEGKTHKVVPANVINELLA